MSDSNPFEKASASSEVPGSLEEQGGATDNRPNLFADKSFWGMICTQFLGAFNDNLYKQLMLLLAIPAAAAGAAAAGAQNGGDVQGWATLVFSLPFVLLSGYAGYLSDRFSKTPIIVLCKVTEIIVMLLGLAAFYFFDLFGTAGTWIVLFLMGTQSSFFGPGKYGILPELFRKDDLPRANGVMVMTTFLAIIFGTVFAGGLKKVLVGEDGSADSLWLGLLICVGIAIVGTLSSLLVRRVAPANPSIKLTKDCFALHNEIAQLLKADKPLLGALLVSSVFWLVSGIAVPTVNRLGLSMLEADDLMTSALTASIGLGIMIGALLASLLCRKGYSQLCVKIGLFGVFGTLVALGAWRAGQVHLLGFWGSVCGLVLMGVFAAIFAIPIQVFLQSRPPVALKGRMIATMNQANFIGILISGPLYQVFESFASWLNWPVSAVFWMMAVLMLPVAIVYNLDEDSEPTEGAG